MTRRHIHYEAAFQDFLRSRGLPYVGVNEAQRAIFAGEKVKSFDFVVYPGKRPNWLVEVKGRQFPYESGGSRRFWENWVAAEDLEMLATWEQATGDEFRAMLVFAYALLCEESRWPTDQVHRFRDHTYAFLGVALTDYQPDAKQRSPKWGTVNVPTQRFREIAKPVQEWWGIE